MSGGWKNWDEVRPFTRSIVKPPKPGPSLSLFGDIPIQTSKGVPPGHVLVLGAPDERQLAGLDSYPREDQYAVGKLDDTGDEE